MHRPEAPTGLASGNPARPDRWKTETEGTSHDIAATILLRERTDQEGNQEKGDAEAQR